MNRDKVDASLCNSPEECIDVGAQVEVAFPNESSATITLMGLWVVSEHHQVLVSVTADEGQGCVVHQVLNSIYL